MTNTLNTDVLIIGAGAAGLTAALAAHDSGAKVTIIEKGARLGGTAAISGGIVWVPDNPQMKAKGIPDNREDALSYFRSLDHGEMNSDTLEAFVDQGTNALEFLNSQGALELHVLDGYPDYYLNHPGAKADGGRALDNALFDFTSLGDWADKIYNGGDIVRMMLLETPLGGGSGIIDPEEMQRRIEGDLRGWGQALIGRLLRACLDREIELLLETSARKLVNKEGRITGVTVTKDGVDRTIDAQRGVILATGGFEWDEELKTTFLRGPLSAPASPPTNTGDGLGHHNLVRKLKHHKPQHRPAGKSRLAGAVARPDRHLTLAAGQRLQSLLLIRRRRPAKNLNHELARVAAVFINEVN